jgi:DNA-binding FadR family transcriptional regulator
MSRLHHDVMWMLIGDITSGVFTPGDHLPREPDVVGQFGMSRDVVGECIRALEERGLVTVKHGRGAAVTAPRRWDTFDPDVLEALLEGRARERATTPSRRRWLPPAAGLPPSALSSCHGES